MKTFCQILLYFLVLIPIGCNDLIVKPAGSNQHVEDFEAIWNRVNEVYPFLEYKGINWDSVYQEYLPRVEAAKGDNYLLVLNELLSTLKDGHLYYKLLGGSEIYPFYPSRHFKDRHAYSPFVVRTYFNKELLLTESGSAEYEIIPGNIGYVFLSDFHGNYLANEFPLIMSYLKNTRGMIIDIRQKRGGGYQNVLAIVSYFLTTPLEPPEFYVLGELVEQEPIEPNEDFSFINPVVVLVNGSTFSAGEVTTEILKQLPQVTVVGDTTGGGGVASTGYPPEAVGEFALPSGMKVYIGTSYFERYDGQPFEGQGIPPDFRVVQTEQDIQNGIDKHLEYALSILN